MTKKHLLIIFTNFFTLVLIPAATFFAAPIWTEFTASKKALGYEVIAKSTIGSKDFKKDVWPEIRLLFNDKPVLDGTLLSLSLENNGGAPIARNDFDGPIQIEITNPKSIEGHRISSKSPKNLLIEVESNQTGLIVKPLLLNPGDYFTIEILGSSDFDVTAVSARISGISRVEKKEVRPENGLYIDTVRNSGIGWTLQSSLIRLPPLALSIAVFILIFYAFYLLRARSIVRALHPIEKILHWLAFGLTYATGLVAAALLIFALKVSEYSKFMQILILFFTTGGAFITALYAKSILNRSRLPPE